MIELKKDVLRFSFPDVHRDAVFEVEFQRTLRIPDDGRHYPLPAGLGRFPLRHVDDFEDVPAEWRRHGGVMLPMFQSEAMWLNFTSPRDYPFALRVAAGKIDAVAGGEWSEGLRTEDQNYLVIPSQPWLDGFCVEKGTIRQFVAMPLGAGYSAEEQITGRAENGGLQLQAYPLKARAWERLKKEQASKMRWLSDDAICFSAAGSADMALAPGGRMRQEIYEDRFDPEDWDRSVSSRCFVHLLHSLVWRAVTGERPPTTPPTAKEYRRARVPWFDYYDDRESPVEGAEALARLKSVAELGEERGEIPLPGNESIEVDRVRHVGPKKRKGQVREGAF
jgi:hypothetical protein